MFGNEFALAVARDVATGIAEDVVVGWTKKERETTVAKIAAELVFCPVNNWHLSCIGFRYLSRGRYRDADGTTKSRARVATY
jgi:hypothetical protein